jgi:hypothetical protein
MAEAYFFNQTSFHHAETGFLTTPSFNPPNPVATGLRTIQFLFLSTMTYSTVLVWEACPPFANPYVVNCVKEHECHHYVCHAADM